LKLCKCYQWWKQYVI